MKYETCSEYNLQHARYVEAAFLTVWPGLEAWFDDLVLIGGMVPRYLCGDLASARALPRPVTLDVDLGIAVGADGGQYGTISTALSAQGFTRSTTNELRYEKTVGEFTVPIDFMVEYPPNTSGTVTVDDISASVMPGVKRALATARQVTVTGSDLHGAHQRVCARVCEVGPFIALKLRAFLRRQQPKDAFDLLYTITYYDGGSRAAIAAFGDEVRAGNTACPDALQALEQQFTDDNAPGPVKASHFALGQVDRRESEDIKFRRASIRQDMLDVAVLLRKAAGA